MVQINFNNKHRDKIILSKGHAAPCLYGVAMEKKILEKNFKYLRKIGSKLQGHPDRKFFNHIDLGTGALGQGLSVAIGYGIASYLQKKKFDTYCILGDGELQEGQIWEAAMYIGSKKILNVCTIIGKPSILSNGFSFKRFEFNREGIKPIIIMSLYIS